MGNYFVYLGSMMLYHILKVLVFLCLVKNFCYYVIGYGLCNYANFHAFLVFVFPTILLSSHFHYINAYIRFLSGCR